MSNDTSFIRGAQVIQSFVAVLPATPGVYRMLGQDGAVLYVGKAKNLKKRVHSYTQQNRLSVRIQRMVAATLSMTFIQTHTEVEALLLEANLIKSLKPKYNILLKDDKFFSYLWLTDHPYPRLQKYRGSRRPDGRFFGPFTSGDATERTLISLYKIFRIRSCSDSVFAGRKRPCLQYHIKRCSAPCVGLIGADGYNASVQQVADFLSGKGSMVQEDLARQMQNASDEQAYEKAAQIRDQIRALTHIQSQQTIHLSGIQEADVLAFASVGGRVCIQLFIYRWGSQCGSYTFFPTGADEDDPVGTLAAFIALFYGDKEPPDLILLNHPLGAENDVLTAALRAQHGKTVEVRCPKRGPLKDVVDNAARNGLETLNRQWQEAKSQKERLTLLKVHFALSKVPERIEIYDNSHIQGTNAIGAMVVAGPEGFDKKQYRQFIIRDPKVFGDDYGMMREVMVRRFSGTLSQKGDDFPLPDLLLIDGGAGQLSCVLDVLKALGVDIPVVAIAKGPDRHAGRETFFQEGRAPFSLFDEPALLFYLQNLRDEAHRYAIGFHRERRAKNLTGSRLDGIPGVGATRRRALLRHFGSARDVAQAGVQDLQKVSGISQNLAQAIYDFFHRA